MVDNDGILFCSPTRVIDILFFHSVVSQDFTTKAQDEYVIRGNDVLVKCKVPSFVSDFVRVLGWTDGEGNNYAGGDNNYGKMS
jgi:hypothetical protein